MKQKIISMIMVTVLLGTYLVPVINATESTDMNKLVENIDEKEAQISSEDEINKLERSGKALEYVEHIGHPYLRNENFTVATSGTNGQLMYYKVNGKIVFCIQATEPVSDWATSTSEVGSHFNSFSPIEKTTIEHITSFGLKYYNETGNTDYLYATQVLIWTISNTSSFNNTSIFQSETSISSEMREIQDSVIKYNVRPSFMSSTASGAKTYTLKWDGSKFTTTTEVDSNGVANDKLSELNGKVIDGFTYTVNNNKLTISTTNPYLEDTTLKFDYVPYESGYSYFYDAGQDLVQVGADPLNLYLKLEIEALGNLNIIKSGENLDETNDSMEKLDDTKFQLFQNGSLIREGTTDNNGELLFKDLVVGNYTLKEVESKTGYILNSKEVEVEIIPAETVTKEIINEHIEGNMKLQKLGHEYDDTYETLKDVEFTLYQDVEMDGSYETEVGKYYTDNRGLININGLDYGNYKIVETQVADNYLADFEQEFEIRTEEQTVLIESSEGFIINEKVKGVIEIQKSGESLDNASDEVVNLEGAEFTLYEDVNLNGELELYEELFFKLESTVTDNNGKALFIDLDLTNQYLVKEVSAPEGYVLSDNVYVISSDSEGVIDTENYTITYQVNVTNDVIKGKIDLNKIAVGTGKESEEYALEDVVFALYQDLNNNGAIDKNESKPIEMLKTDEEGYAISNEIKYGNYLVKEVSAPDEVLIDETTVYKASITENDVVVTLNDNKPIENKLITNLIKISKTDFATGEELEGAELVVYDSNGDVYEQWTSTTEAYKFYAVYGNYSVCEDFAPIGYQRLTECVKFEVTENGVVQKLKIENKLIPVTISTTGNNLTFLYVAAFSTFIGTVIVVIRKIRLK